LPSFTRVNFRIYTRKLSIIGKSSQWGWSSLQPVLGIDKEIAPGISGTYRKSAHKSGAKFIKESHNCGSWLNPGLDENLSISRTDPEDVRFRDADESPVFAVAFARACAAALTLLTVPFAFVT
jgi:hypothetical protein